MSAHCLSGVLRFERMGCLAGVLLLVQMLCFNDKELVIANENNGNVTIINYMYPC